MDANANSLESDLIRIRKDQEHIIKKELDVMRNQLNTAEDTLKNFKTE
jgi:hypothetical protein